MVGKAVALFYGHSFRGPRLEHGIVILAVYFSQTCSLFIKNKKKKKEGRRTHFVITYRNRLVNVVANGPDLLVSLCFLLESKLFCLLLGLFKSGLLLNQVACVFFILPRSSLLNLFLYLGVCFGGDVWFSERTFFFCPICLRMPLRLELCWVTSYRATFQREWSVISSPIWFVL